MCSDVPRSAFQMKSNHGLKPSQNSVSFALSLFCFVSVQMLTVPIHTVLSLRFTNFLFSVCIALFRFFVLFFVFKCIVSSEISNFGSLLIDWRLSWKTKGTREMRRKAHSAGSEHRCHCEEWQQTEGHRKQKAIAKREINDVAFTTIYQNARHAIRYGELCAIDLQDRSIKWKLQCVLCRAPLPHRCVCELKRKRHAHCLRDHTTRNVCYIVSMRFSPTYYMLHTFS